MAMLSSKTRKKSSFYVEKCLVGLTSRDIKRDNMCVCVSESERERRFRDTGGGDVCMCEIT
jgi:hypothetical protein